MKRMGKGYLMICPPLLSCPMDPQSRVAVRRRKGVCGRRNKVGGADYRHTGDGGGAVFTPYITLNLCAINCATLYLGARFVFLLSQ